MSIGSVITVALIVIECFVLAMVIRVRDPNRADIQALGFWFFLGIGFAGIAIIGYLMARGPLTVLNADVSFFIAQGFGALSVLFLAIMSVRYFTDRLVWTIIAGISVVFLAVTGTYMQLLEQDREQWAVPVILFAPILILHAVALLRAFVIDRDIKGIWGVIGIVIMILAATYKYAGVPLASYFDQTAVFHTLALIAFPLTFLGFLALIGEREFQPSSYKRR